MSINEIFIDREFFQLVCAGVQRKWKLKQIIHSFSQPSIYLFTSWRVSASGCAYFHESVFL